MSSFVTRYNERQHMRQNTVRNREMLRARHAELRTRVDAIREQLRERSRGSRFVLRPSHNKWLAYWDVVSTGALIYTATLTPFEVAFLTPAAGSSAWTEPWFLINRCLDVVFGTDICMQFFTAVQVTQADGQVVWIDDHATIIRNCDRRTCLHFHVRVLPVIAADSNVRPLAYTDLRSWFPIDIFTVVVPSSFDVYIAQTSDAIAAGSSGVVGSSASSSVRSPESSASLLRILRILRLFKLVRLARASRIVKRWQARVTLHQSTITLLTSTLQLLLATHWCARHPVAICPCSSDPSM